MDFQSIHLKSLSVSLLEQFNNALNDNYEAEVHMYKKFFQYIRASSLMKKFMIFLIRNLIGPRLANSTQVLRQYSHSEIDNFIRAKNRFEDQYKLRWEEQKLDALICPTYPHSAFKHEDEELAFQVNFLAPWNVLDYPSGNVPITEVKAGEDKPEDYNDNWNDVIT